MNSIKNYLTSFFIAVVLIQLCLVIYGGLKDEYNIVPEPGKNLFDTINDMNIVAGPIRIGEGIKQLLSINILNPLDLVGGLMNAGLGTLQTLAGVITLPVEIMDAFIPYYDIPAAIYFFIGNIVLVSIGILILQLYIKPFQPM